MTNRKNISNSKNSDTDLAVLRYLENKQTISQRELSNDLGISLGKINFILKALIKKGIVKAKNFKNNNNKSVYAYYLTADGLNEKAKLTLEFFKRKNTEYNKLKKELKDLQQEITLLDRRKSKENITDIDIDE
jgi:EPS-associated MarR family transcriptional regulator|tara:strand:- start:21 stop:419 length:399 start_codon:yes stop_codon:yes gene_type:complete